MSVESPFCPECRAVMLFGGVEGTTGFPQFECKQGHPSVIAVVPVRVVPLRRGVRVLPTDDLCLHIHEHLPGYRCLEPAGHSIPHTYYGLED